MTSIKGLPRPVSSTHRAAGSAAPSPQPAAQPAPARTGWAPKGTSAGAPASSARAFGAQSPQQVDLQRYYRSALTISYQPWNHAQAQEFLQKGGTQAQLTEFKKEWAKGYLTDSMKLINGGQLPHTDDLPNAARTLGKDPRAQLKHVKDAYLEFWNGPKAEKHMTQLARTNTAYAVIDQVDKYREGARIFGFKPNEALIGRAVELAIARSPEDAQRLRAETRPPPA